jgi:hypothetical protein
MHSLITYILHIAEEIRIRKLPQTLKVVFQTVGTLSPISETFSSNGDRLSPAAETFSPIGDRFSPMAETFSPIGDRLSPMTETFSPIGDRLSPTAETFSPIGDRLSPTAETFSPIGDTLSQTAETFSPYRLKILRLYTYLLHAMCNKTAACYILRAQPLQTQSRM